MKSEFRLIVLSLFISLNVFAQPGVTDRKQSATTQRLRIGDKVPDLVFNKMRNYSARQGKLSDFRNKFIILDFWSKYCTNCIAGFPHLQQIQDEFRNDLQVLLVTRNTEDELTSHFKNSPNVKNCKLPMVFGDTILGKVLFPHSGEPYQVWIDNRGIVRASTHSFAATSANIKDLIAGNPLKNVPLLQPDLYNVDLSKPLLHDASGQLLPLLLYYSRNASSDKDRPYSFSDAYSAIFRETENLKMGNRSLIDDKRKTNIGFRASARTMLSLYCVAFNLPVDTRIIIDDPNSEKYFVPVPGDATHLTSWRKNNLYIYEQIFPKENDDEKFQIMKNDLIRYFGLKGKIEKRLFPSIVVYRIGKENKLRSRYIASDTMIKENTRSKEGYVIKNYWFKSAVFNHLKRYILEEDESAKKQLGKLLIDETGFDPEMRIDMTIKSDLRNRQAVIKELASYGLGIKEEMRETEVLVLSK